MLNALRKQRALCAKLNATDSKHSRKFSLWILNRQRINVAQSHWHWCLFMLLKEECNKPPMPSKTANLSSFHERCRSANAWYMISVQPTSAPHQPPELRFRIMRIIWRNLMSLVCHLLLSLRKQKKSQPRTMPRHGEGCNKIVHFKTKRRRKLVTSQL